MLTKLQQKKSVGNKHENAYYLALVFSVLLSLVTLSGCEKSDDETLESNDKSGHTVLSKGLPNTVKSASFAEINKAIVFAPTVDKNRKGLWLGGSPPINKRASGIDTYYRIKETDQPNQLTITLRFEGVVGDDATILVRPIDGAKFNPSNQRTKWRLKPNMISEITFTVVVPEGVSYLALDTFQKNQGAARAFILKASDRKNTK
jgi:hypothetical protein